MGDSGQFTEVVIDPRILQRFAAKAIGGFVSEAVNDALRRLNEANDALWALEKSIPYQLSVTKP